ncbi:MAG: glutamate racemase [Candidatus Cloacimonetes bacterium 4572_55]|nr:MAG: glutamate racemase [Candidatus Cloacimonetes bacterium 4572_55]
MNELPDDQKAIGIFDSGIGGLTVVAEIFRALPYEKVIYFGDIAHLPYGSKSRNAIRKFSLQIVRFLLRFPIKMIVVACNTASADAIDLLQDTTDLPTIGVVQPGAIAGVKSSKNGRIGVIGTTGAIDSGAYQRAIRDRRPDVEIFARDCPLFVPLVEEGWLDHDVTYQIAERYLYDLKINGIDSLILGCTHYPLLKTVIGKVMGPGVSLVDSATETAKEVADTLDELDMATSLPIPPSHRYYVSDFSPYFKRIGELCLGRPLHHVIRVDLDQPDNIFDDFDHVSNIIN